MVVATTVDVVLVPLALVVVIEFDLGLVEAADEAVEVVLIVDVLRVVALLVVVEGEADVEVEGAEPPATTPLAKKTPRPLVPT